MISATNDKKDDRSSEDDENKIMRKGVKIMDKLEKVEKLRAKTGVSYEDAKNALEACDYDLLDASHDRTSNPVKSHTCRKSITEKC